MLMLMIVSSSALDFFSHPGSRVAKTISALRNVHHQHQHRQGLFSPAAEEPQPQDDFSPDDADDALELLRAFGHKRRATAVLGRGFYL